MFGEDIGRWSSISSVRWKAGGDELTGSGGTRLSGRDPFGKSPRGQIRSDYVETIVSSRHLQGPGNHGEKIGRGVPQGSSQISNHRHNQPRRVHDDSLFWGGPRPKCD